MKVKKGKYLRSIIQVLIFALIAIIAVNKTLVESGGGFAFLSSASLHAICPFGGVVTLYNLLTVGTFIQKIHGSAVVLMALVFFITVLFGPAFCGWICPLGSIQEWFGKLGKKIFKKKYNNIMPQKLDKVLRYFRLLVLGWVVFVTARSGSLIFSDIDPYQALFNFWTNEVAIQALVILLVTLSLSFIVERPWCKYACPYGALLGFTNKFRIFKIKRNTSSCISCNKCDQVCPMNIEVSSTGTVSDLQCISCLKCTSDNSCPVPNTVELIRGDMK